MGDVNSSDWSPSLASQAQAILEAATSLQKQLNSASLPQPSFAPSGRRDWSDANHLPELLETRLRLLDATQSMLDLVMGPMDTISYFAGPLVTKFEVIRTLDTLKVSEHVPLTGDVNIIELAHELGVEQSILERHLRCAYLMGVFRESRKGYVAHTGLSAEMPKFSAYTQLRLSELYVRSSFYVPEAMRLNSKESSTKMAVPVELSDRTKCGRDFWIQLVEDDLDGKGMEKFSAGMKTLGMTLFGGNHSSFVQAFDWDNIEKGTLIDVGGGNGHIEVNIAKRLPGMQFLIQDLETNAEPARQTIEQRGLQDRIQFQTHDFFGPQPVDLKPSAYLLSRVLHDWQDKDCIRILENLVPAMEKHKTKLLITERVMPDNVGEMSAYKEWPSRMTDILMYMLNGSKERTLEDFKVLLSKADSRLQVVKCIQPVYSVFAFLEVELMQ